MNSANSIPRFDWPAYYRERPKSIYWQQQAEYLARSIIDQIGPEAYDAAIAPLPEPETWMAWYEMLDELAAKVDWG